MSMAHPLIISLNVNDQGRKKSTTTSKLVTQQSSLLGFRTVLKLENDKRNQTDRPTQSRKIASEIVAEARVSLKHPTRPFTPTIATSRSLFNSNGRKIKLRIPRRLDPLSQKPQSSLNESVVNKPEDSFELIDSEDRLTPNQNLNLGINIVDSPSDSENWSDITEKLLKMKKEKISMADASLFEKQLRNGLSELNWLDESSAQTPEIQKRNKKRKLFIVNMLLQFSEKHDTTPVTIPISLIILK
ncbi:hypothetical protein HK096_008023, partial [Nowakowskiella sp. JEL0078]